MTAFSDLLHRITTEGLRVLIALVILFVTFKIINFLVKKLEARLLHSQYADKTLSKSLLYVCRVGAKILIVICLVGYLGIDTSGLSALIASLGVCIGLAVNGTLSNLAGGVILLVTRPFKVDDYISVAGYEGTVEDIQIITTNIRTLDNKMVYIPNGTISTSSIVNYSAKNTRRVDLVFSISYDADFEQAKRLILDACAAHQLVLSDPAPFARVSSHNDSSIDITMRAWCNTADYWTVYFDLLETVKKEFDNANIEIPFPQMDVHMKQ